MFKNTSEKTTGKTTHLFKKTLFFFLFLVVNFLTAQSPIAEKTKVDSLIQLANQYYMEMNSGELLKVSKTILQKSKNINYDKGQSYGNYYIAICFSLSGNYKESIQYLEKSQSFSKYLSEDHLHNFRITGSLADNYRDLELYPLAISSYHETLKILKRIKNKTAIDSLSEAANYDNLSMLYAAMNVKDSVYYYLNKDKAILSKIEMEDAYIEKSSCFIGLGTYHFKNKRIDSANYYFDQSLILLKNKNHPFELDALMGKARIFATNNKNSEALKYYFEALDKATVNDFKQLEVSVYKAIAELYYKNGKTAEANKYRKKYDELRTQLDNQLRLERSIVLGEVLKQEKLDSENTQKNSVLKMYITVGISVILLIIAFYFVARSKKQNKKIRVESGRLLAEKEHLISKKSEETQVLQLKINESFEEVTQLAKDNSPEFFGRFQEVYPTFVSRLEKISPKMRLSELTLCAYIFLGYNTKDISIYTFKSVHTIRSRKYNLRKKFSLAPDDNMELWLKKVMSNNL